jgi:mycofactocin precursor
VTPEPTTPDLLATDQAIDQTSDKASDEVSAPAAPEAPLVTEELIVEDVSIDGMCGVY